MTHCLRYKAMQILVLLLLTGCGSGNESADGGSEPISYGPPPNHTPLVANAGGGFQGKSFTNSLQALDASYGAGHRIIEVDMNWTRDRKLVLVSDWDRQYFKLFIDASRLPSVEHFRAMNMKDDLQQMTLLDLFNWLRIHDDAYIITDIKANTVEALQNIAAQAGELTNRFLPQIYEPDQYKPVAEAGYSNIIFSLYKTKLSDARIIEFTRKNPIFAIAMSESKATDTSNTLARDLQVENVFVYAQTINNIDDFVTELRMRGVSGIYTDFLNSTDLQQAESEDKESSKPAENGARGG